jgi:hypothetical protein
MDWAARLKHAAARVEESAAPDWLKAAMRVAVERAPDLAPEAPRDAAPPEFFYPH